MTGKVRIATHPGLLILLCAALLPVPLPAAAVAELWEKARHSTFEVVLPKVEPTEVTYEKTLPLELLPFAERNDKYWSIGTAFAIAPDIFVSNAHVLTTGMASPLGPPHLRDAAGATYPIERILRFSLHEDFIVFRARGARATGALSINKEPAVGAKVYAVGNALGEGVVLRDGLLTSMTPEEQDGRWKWLRFSAAASPGNSGGPLLDEAGNVVGVVTARSPGENLNYALPIARVLEGSERTASIDVRSSFGLPILRQQMVAEYKEGFDLPASWDDFSRRLIQAGSRQYEASQQALLQRHAADLPPVGRSADLLAELEVDKRLALIEQQPDDSWGMSEPTGTEDTQLDADSTLRIGRFEGAFSFMLWHDDALPDPRMHRDGKGFMDNLLKGIKLPRMVGTQAIRITSLGEPRQQALHVDRFGRIWQLRDWSVGYDDMQLVTLALPVPDGYVGLLQLTTAARYANTVAGLKLMGDFVHAAYDGTASQWQAFVAQKDLCPPFLRAMQFGADSGVALRLPGLEMRIPASVLPLTAASTLSVFTGYADEKGRLVAVPAGITVTAAPDEDDGSWFGVWAQPRPGADARGELQKRWREMSARGEGFDGMPRYNAERTRFWTTSSVGSPEAALMYEVNVSLAEKSLLPRQVTERRERLLSGLSFSAPEVN